MKVKMVWIENHTLAYSFRNTWQLLISSITTLFQRKHQPEAKDDSAHWFFKMYHQHSFKKDRFVGLCLQNVSSTRPHHSHSVSPQFKRIRASLSLLLNWMSRPHSYWSTALHNIDSGTAQINKSRYTERKSK